MIHLKYPRKRGFLYWDELRCLARALGFPVDAFYHNIPEEITSQQDGVTTQEFLAMLDKQKLFHFVLDMTFNIHTDEWNVASIKKSVPLLDNHVHSFEDLQTIRLSFQTYECPDTRGMLLDVTTLLRAIKMCGRMISPLKMMHRIKHMKPNLEDEERIQLHEFLDLLMWCDTYRGIAVGPPEYDTSKDELEMFKMDSFGKILSHHDERLHEQLDEDYLKQEWHFAKEKHDTKRKMPKDIPPVNPDIRKTLVDYHKQRFSRLHSEIKEAQDRVYKAKAGYVRGRPVSAPELDMYSERAELLTGSLGPEMRPPTVLEVGGHLIRSPSPKPPRTSQDIREEIPRPRLSEQVHSNVCLAVTKGDLRHTQDEVNALKFAMETVGSKYRQRLNEHLDIMIPGYREREEKRPKSVPVPDRPKPKSSCGDRRSNDLGINLPKAEVLRSISSHNKICDARFRGWYGPNNRKGHHFVLVEPYFDTTLQGQMFAKMRAQRKQEAEQSPYVYRHTLHGKDSSASPERSPRTTSTEDKVRSTRTDSQGEKQHGGPCNKEQNIKLGKYHSKAPERTQDDSTQTKTKIRKFDTVNSLTGNIDPEPDKYVMKRGVRVPLLRAITDGVGDDVFSAEVSPAPAMFSTPKNNNFPGFHQIHFEEDTQSDISSSDASFLSMDVTFNPELRAVAQKGPAWLEQLLRNNGDVQPKSSKTPQACKRLVGRFNDQLSADFRRKLQDSVPMAY